MTEKADLFGKAREARSHSRAAAKSMVELVRMMALAGVGAAALAKDETERLATRLIERGDQARRGRHSHLFGGQVSDLRGRRVGSVLNRMNVPTREDLAEINAKIADLTAKIDAIQGEAGGKTEDIDPSTQI